MAALQSAQGRGGGGGGAGGDGRDNRSGPVSQLEDLMRRRGVDQAWDALQEMMRAGLPADRFTVSRMLMRTLADGRRSWDPAKINRSVALVEQFVQIQPQEADEVLFNAILDTHSRTKDIAKLETTFQRMKDLGVEPSHVTLGILVKAYGQVCDIKKVVQLWDEMVEQREQANAVTYGCMINACVKCSQTEKALSIFRDMQKRHKQCNTILYTTLIKGYGNEKDLNTAIMLFREMREEGVPYNTIAYNSIIDVCIKCTEVAKAEEFFQEMMSDSSTVQPDLITYSTLLKGYCQVGDLDKALQVAATIKACGMQCDELVYNTLMDGCVKANDLSAGVGLFAEMASAGMKPSSITHSIFLRLYQRNGYKGNALDAVAQLYQHHGLEKPSGMVEKASKAAARRENRAKGSKSRNGAGTKQSTRARQGPAKQGGYDAGTEPEESDGLWLSGTQGGWQRTQAAPYAPNSVADASQRLPGSAAYLASPATFAGMALEDLSGYPQGHPGAQGQVGHAMPMHQAPHAPHAPHAHGAPYQMGPCPPHAMGPAPHQGCGTYMPAGCHQGPCGPGPGPQGPCIQMHPGMGPPQVSFQASSGRAPARPVHYGPPSGGDQQAKGLRDVVRWQWGILGASRPETQTTTRRRPATARRGEAAGRRAPARPGPRGAPSGNIEGFSEMLKESLSLSLSLSKAAGFVGDARLRGGNSSGGFSIRFYVGSALPRAS
ncbi:unnamed protein product [Symbiodinium sp. CCMP2592]|nr:unnamed protein product [Symbiodinium sp. CCMP2592]